MGYDFENWRGKKQRKRVSVEDEEINLVSLYTRMFSKRLYHKPPNGIVVAIFIHKVYYTQHPQL
jgi:hypothetical protein